jgi:hypothetical protein
MSSSPVNHIIAGLLPTAKTLLSGDVENALLEPLFYNEIALMEDDDDWAS